MAKKKKAKNNQDGNYYRRKNPAGIKFGSIIILFLMLIFLLGSVAIINTAFQ